MCFSARSVDDLADTVAASTIIKTIDQVYLLSHTINHPIFGDCLTIQAGGKCLLVKSL
jgi:hypothetical protein